MTLARQRQDLIDQNLSIPSGSGAFIQVTEWLECTQPDNLDDHFYNVVLWKTVDGKKYAWERFSSVDLDFKEA